MSDKEVCKKIPVTERGPITEREYQEWKKNRDKERKKMEDTEV